MKKVFCIPQNRFINLTNRDYKKKKKNYSYWKEYYDINKMEDK